MNEIYHKYFVFNFIISYINNKNDKIFFKFINLILCYLYYN